MVQVYFREQVGRYVDACHCRIVSRISRRDRLGRVTNAISTNSFTGIGEVVSLALVFFRVKRPTPDKLLAIGPPPAGRPQDQDADQPGFYPRTRFAQACY